jgi:hypothetical protein
LADIKDLLLELHEKVDRLERKVADMDKRIGSGLNVEKEIKLVKVIIILYINVYN